MPILASPGILKVSRRLSHYEIVQKLGSGGMGEVYLALDTRLDRTVALKILPPEFSADRKRLSRFLQEARLAAKINHPNICTIYEVGETEESPYISMEFLEGVTLADLIREQRLEAAKILALLFNIADALSEAHRNGVIHRDIKPENVIINRRGEPKVLDFGLAKTVGAEVSEQAVTRAKTEAGMLVGTVQYMSPEQLLGKTLDARTDLWSLGVVLYEMVFGEPPFRGATQAVIFDQILHKTPDFPDEAELPEGLAEIILKLLEKERELRYQTAEDLLADIRRLRRSLGQVSDSGESEIGFGETYAASKSSRKSGRQTGGKRRTGSFRTGRTLFDSSLYRYAGGIAAAFLLISVLAIGGYFYLKAKPDSISFENAEVNRISGLWKVLDSVISPDGKFIVYVTDEGVSQSLWLRNISTGSSVQIVEPRDVMFQGLAVSPDGNWVYFNIWDKKTVGEIFRVPVLGGKIEKIVHDCMPSVAISGDGARIAFIRSDSRNQTMLLMTADAKGGDERVVMERTGKKRDFQSPVWSPDSTSIAFVEYEVADDNSVRRQISEIPAAGGERRVIWKDADRSFSGMGAIVWLKDNSGFVTSLDNAVWHISYPDGQLRRLTNTSENYGSLSISDDGNTMVSIVRDHLFSIWVVPVDDPSEAKLISDGKLEGYGIDWTPDGRIVYSSGTLGKFDIWIMNADGTGKRQLTFDNAANHSPCVTSDGKNIVFFSMREGSRSGLKMIGTDGSDLRFFSDLKYSYYPTCSRSDNSVFYLAGDESGVSIHRKLADGTEETQVLKAAPQQMTISPDGQRLAYVLWDEERNSYKREIFDIASGERYEFRLPESGTVRFGEIPNAFRFTHDGKNISFVNEEGAFSNVWHLPPDGGSPKRVTNFKENIIFKFAWSRDGKHLAVSRGLMTNDVVLFRRR